ncbi:hypothetical protein ACVWZR_001646 [Bradyrhizobium sp. i1.3.1]
MVLAGRRRKEGRPRGALQRVRRPCRAQGAQEGLRVRLRNHRGHSRSTRERSPGAHPHRAGCGPQRSRRLRERADHDHAADQGGACLRTARPPPQPRPSQDGLPKRRHAAPCLCHRIRHPGEHHAGQAGGRAEKLARPDGSALERKNPQRRSADARRRRRALLGPAGPLRARLPREACPAGPEVQPGDTRK